MKTMAIRLDDHVHARLTILARLSDSSITDVVRDAIEARLDVLASDPAVSAKASALAEEIERDAREQRAALAQLFGGNEDGSTPLPTSDEPSSTTTRRSGQKG